MAAPLRVVYFGTPEFAIPTLTTLIQAPDVTVVAVVSQPDRPKGRGHRVAATPTKALAVLCGIPVLQPTKLRDTTFLSDLAALHPDLGVVAAYGRILPDALLQLPRLGMINVHGSLLPKYRGAAPVHRAVLAGDTITGVTIMRVVQELDAGPMLAATSRPIDPDETSMEVERALAQMGAVLLLDVVRQMARGDAVETPQDHAQVSYAPKVEKSESPIDWSLPARRIHNQVRGLQPWPLASTTIAGTRCLIHRTALGASLPGSGIRDSGSRDSGSGDSRSGDSRSGDSGSGDSRSEDSRSGDSGLVISDQGFTVSVLAGDGQIVRLLQIQPEGRKTMSAREFLSGHRIKPGDRLGNA
jgi:methionyl-tRNA formyltransferase